MIPWWAPVRALIPSTIPLPDDGPSPSRACSSRDAGCLWKAPPRGPLGRRKSPAWVSNPRSVPERPQQTWERSLVGAPQRGPGDPSTLDARNSPAESQAFFVFREIHVISEVRGPRLLLEGDPIATDLHRRHISRVLRQHAILRRRFIPTDEIDFIELGAQHPGILSVFPHDDPASDPPDAITLFLRRPVQPTGGFHLIHQFLRN